jgi:hypothetical protein
MTSRRSFLAGSTFVAVLATLSVLAAPSRSLAQGSALDALPPDTALVVRMRNGSEMVKKFKASPLYGLKDHPELKGFIDEMKKNVDEGMQEARDKLGFDLFDLLAALEGESIFAIGGLDKVVAALTAEMSGGEAEVAPGDLPLIFVGDTAGSAPKFREYMGKIAEFVQKEGARKQEDSFQGGKIIAFDFTPQKPGKAEGAKKEEKKEGDSKGNEDADAEEGDDEEEPSGEIEKFFIGEMGTKFFFALSRPYLEKVMSGAAQAPADSLVKSPDIALTRREMGDGDLSVLVNMRSIAGSARKNLQANPMGAMVWQIVEGKILGPNLKNLGVSINMTETEIGQTIFVNNGGAAEGLLGILKGAPFASKPNALIPEDTNQFTSVSLNIPYLYKTVKDIYQMVGPFLQMSGAMSADGPQDLDGMFEKEVGMKLKDVVDALGGQMHFCQKGAGTPDNPLGDMVFAFELKDPAKISMLLEKLSPKAGFKPQKVEGRDFYPLGMMGPEADGPALAIGETYFFVGTKGGLVKDALASAAKPGKNVGETKAYQDVSGGVPAQVNALSFSNTKAMRDSLSAIRQALSSMGQPAPDLSAVAEVIGGSVGWGIWKEGGFYSRSTTTLKRAKAATADK